MNHSKEFNEEPYVKQHKLYIETQPDGKRVLTTIATPSISEEDNAQFITNGDTLEVNVEDLDEIASRFFSDEFYITPDLTNKNIAKLKIKSNKPLKINPGAFEYCSQLQSVEIECPEEVVICNNAFSSCYGLKDVSIKSKEKLDKVEFESDAFKGCSELENVDISKSNDTIFSSGCFQGCNNLETVNQDATNTQIGANAFFACRELKEFSFPTLRLNTANGVFKSCGNLENAHISNINLLTGGTCKKYSDLFENTKIHIKEAKVSDLIRNIDYKNFVFENLYIDSIGSVGIGYLNKLLSSYPPDSFKKIYIGQFEVSRSILNKGNIANIEELFSSIVADPKVINVLSSIYKHYCKDSSLLDNLLNKSSKEAIEKNIEYFESLGIDASTAFLSTPNLLSFDIHKVFENIKKIRGFSAVTDADVCKYYFDDTDFMIKLDNPRSIELYLVSYIKDKKRLPRGLSSLFFEGDYEGIVDRVDRLNYVSSMHITGRDVSEYLDKKSVDTLKNLDNVAFNNAYGGYGDMSSKVNERVPNLRGIKYYVYEKLKGYIYQDADENILFDEVFGDAIYENHSISEMLTYYNKICEYFDDNSSKDLEYKKNVICGRVLYTLIKSIKGTKNNISEDFVRKQLFDFKNIRTGLLAPGFLSSNLDSVDDPDAINIMLKIDPYSFDLFRNYSEINDIPLRQQLLAYKAADNGDDKALRTLRKSANNRLLYNIDADMSGIFIGYEDVRYYNLAKAYGYRFTKEEENYYEGKIADFNRQLDELISDKEFEQYRTILYRYKIKKAEIEPNAMTVFYEYLNNRVSPFNNYGGRHTQEEFVKSLVDNFIDSESQETGKSLEKTFSAVNALYRDFNPSILFRSTGTIIDNPSLDNANLQNIIEKVGVAIIALNKMAHQQDGEAISKDLSRYRYQGTESFGESHSLATEVVEALNTIGIFDDIETVYNEMFCDKRKKALKDSQFYRYIDSVDLGVDLRLARLTKTEADKLYSMFKNKHSKLNGESNDTISSKRSIEEEINYRALVNYMKRNAQFDDEGRLIDKGNPLIISEESKSRIIREFNGWRRHYNKSRQIGDIETLSEDDCFRLFIALRQVRDAIRINPDMVDNLVDNSITQSNMFELKNKFSKYFIQTLVDRLDSLDSGNYEDVLTRIIGLDKEEKLKMFKNMGIILEIEEDTSSPASPYSDVLVVYSKNIREPYSIHLNQKVILNDRLRNQSRDNQLITNSVLDNKNLTTNNEEFSIEFGNSMLDFSSRFRNRPLGRETAMLLNFLRIDLPVLFIKYGIKRKTLEKLLSGEISINESNLGEFLDEKTLIELRESLSDIDISNRINNLINSTLKMIRNLEDNRVLSIPKEMILDDDSKYLRYYSFREINVAQIPDIVRMIGKKDVNYRAEYSKNLDQISKEYSAILSNPEDPKYRETLNKIFVEFYTPHLESLDNNTTSTFFYFGNDDITYRMKSGKFFRTLIGIRDKVIDLDKIEDPLCKTNVEKYIWRVLSLVIDQSQPSKALTIIDDLLRELSLEDCELSIQKCNITVKNLDKKFKDLLEKSLREKLGLLAKKQIKSASPNEIAEMIKVLSSGSEEKSEGAPQLIKK